MHTHTHKKINVNCGWVWWNKGTDPKKVAGGAAGDTAGERQRVADEKKFMFLTMSSLPCHKQTTLSNTLTQADDLLLIAKKKTKSNSSTTETTLDRCAKGRYDNGDAQKKKKRSDRTERENESLVPQHPKSF